MVPTSLPCRLIYDAPQSGPWNMAADEALAESTARDGIAVLRFYGWSEPTLSLGYFQSFLDRDRHAASAACPMVRRASGGGAILHDRELTYSLALPCAIGAVGDAPELYFAVHTALVQSLAAWDITATVRECPQGCEQGEDQSSERGTEPFLCFQRRAAGDVLIRGTKVCGSAQRRRRNVLLQHGAVLVETSPVAPELPGIAQLTGLALQPLELSRSWQTWMAVSLRVDFRTSVLTDQEHARTEQLVNEKYGHSAWTRRR